MQSVTYPDGLIETRLRIDAIGMEVAHALH